MWPPLFTGIKPDQNWIDDDDIKKRRVNQEQKKCLKLYDKNFDKKNKKKGYSCILNKSVQ